MKATFKIFTLLLIILAIYLAFSTQLPEYLPDSTSAETSFSTDRALVHVKKIAEEPHGVGFNGHKKVQSYIRQELENLGLKTSLQTGYTAGDWANLSKATNILARIKGSGSEKALVLMSHYDSSPHSSLGASDAGSGVATILEGLRAYLATNSTPKNDIIILITDAEELGLNGADLFVNKHPWAKDVGLVLNFEARGSGGPAYMLLETNKGNANLMREFVKANPEFPVANSLAYSLYKMLPNDTDLTVFREDGDMEGFNFAFIDDHFDYHTAQDTYSRLNKNTLAHQGSYLMPLLKHFSQTNLNLKAQDDVLYFNVPFFKMVTYPFSWIWPLLIFAILLFVGLVLYGLKKEKLQFKEIGLGFAPLLSTLAMTGIAGYFAWPILKYMYPRYTDILHGFTYNGHTYILAYVFLAIGICFWVYHQFKKITTPNLLVAPLFLWLILNTLLAVYLKGATFFILPTLAALAAFYMYLEQEKPNPLLLVFLGIPVIWILAPFIQALPIGLGLKVLVGSTVLVALTFVLLLPLFSAYKNKNRLAYLSFLIFVVFMFKAHNNSDFTPENAKPTSLVYLFNTDEKTAHWLTYDKVLSSWTDTYMNKAQKVDTSENLIKSKYKTRVSYKAIAPLKDIKAPLIETSMDTIIGNERLIKICVTPQRPVHRLEVFTEKTKLNAVQLNEISLSDEYLEKRKSGRLFTHYISDNDDTEITLKIPIGEKLSLTFYEASNNLLTHPLFSVPPRPANNIPMPFVLNDAILTVNTIHYE